MSVRIIGGDAREKLAELADESVHCVVTSPPLVRDGGDVIIPDMEPENLAYAAGVIDSDGYIGVKRSTYSMRVTGDSTQPTYSERVCVKQVEPQAVYLLKSMFGGTLTMGKPTARKGRPLHTWQVTDQKAADCLLAVMPYLRIKREQAINCLDLRVVKERSKAARVSRGRGHRGSARRTDENSSLMEAAYQKGKELNAVGVR